MFVVVSRAVNGLVSYQRYTQKEKALGALLLAKSSIACDAWLEYEPTEKEMDLAHDRNLLLDFTAYCIGEGVFSREVEEIISEFLEVRHEQEN